ncbi:MAG: GNAT family N-acetyltransferase [Clostridiales bacterium]|jgi:GNAT superfamily N-acetyltransferase|nr:GNAT family N-acetyltransferase [Clostridiales bacterium]
MDITVKPLTLKLIPDYFDFFENRAFTDNSPYRCYCQVYQMSKLEYGMLYDNLDWADAGRVSREVAQRQIEAGTLKGYLAYVDGMSIGWCNANDRANYPAEPQYDVPFYAPVEKREKAVICFEIAPEYRMKGVATALLQQVIADAKAEGYIAVIGFPIVRDKRYEWDCRGPMRLYEKTGFVKAGEYNDYMVMRKEL